MPKNKVVKGKKVRGWAVLNRKRGRVLYVEIGRSRPEWFQIGTWTFQVGSHPVVPCEITYKS